MGGWLIDSSDRPRLIFCVFIFLAAGSTFVTTLFPSYGIFLVFWPLTRLFTTVFPTLNLSQVGKMAVIRMLVNYWPSVVMGTVIGISTVR
jgi:nitrate/nitrite transporter NarK